MECFNDILQPCIRASKIGLSYVDKLFPDLKDYPYVVLHKNVTNIHQTELTFHKNEERSFGYDVSGSPLEYSFSNCEFDETLLVTKLNWQKQEELCLPLSKNDACNALNKCHESLNNNTLPILALCDGKDPKRSRLIGSIICNDWFTTLEVVSTGTIALSAIKNECHKIVLEHLKRSSVQERDIRMSVFSTFDLFGTKQEKIDWDKTAKSDFEGSITIETYSNNLTLDPRQSKNTLVVEMNAGWKNSPLKELRQQLDLLIQYLLVIDECKKNVGLQNSIKFTTPFLKEHDAIAEELNLLLNGDVSFRKTKNSNVREINYISSENVEMIKLLECVYNVSSRHNVDFTDFLWEILIGTSEYPQMINYIETILEGIYKDNFIPQVNDTNSTRFIKRISDLRHQGTISHLLVGSVPLELVVDIGFEKLTRDYLYILRGARLVDLYDIRQKLVDISSGIFNTETYRKKLVTLAQIHICLECMLLIEAQLECPIENLQSIFAHVYKEFLSEQSPLQHYTELCSRFYTLTIPLPNAIANDLNKMNPSIWKASLSSHSAASKLTTITYYSKMPIFPTNIYPTDDVKAQEIVYGISATSLSTKYKKLGNSMLPE